MSTTRKKMTKEETELFQKATEAMRLFGENPDAARGFVDALKKGDFSEARASLNASLDRQREEHLSDAEYDRFGNLLGRLPSQDAMNLEELDGFFVALICGPETVLPSEYLREVWGGHLDTGEAVFSRQELEDLLHLIMRHWHFIANTLRSDDVFLPLLLEDEQGVVHANDWATGFMRGMELRRESWGDLIHDEAHGGSLIPIFALAHEHDPDPELRPYQEPISAEQRETIIVHLAAGVMYIYKYFAAKRRMTLNLDAGNTTYRRPTRKVGRNDPCPCGSAKKYKHCCGKVTVH
jgi:uncharacterized protein